MPHSTKSRPPKTCRNCKVSSSIWSHGVLCEFALLNRHGLFNRCSLSLEVKEVYPIITEVLELL